MSVAHPLREHPALLRPGESTTAFSQGCQDHPLASQQLTSAQALLQTSWSLWAFPIISISHSSGKTPCGLWWLIDRPVLLNLASPHDVSWKFFQTSDRKILLSLTFSSLWVLLNLRIFFVILMVSGWVRWYVEISIFILSFLLLLTFFFHISDHMKTNSSFILKLMSEFLRLNPDPEISKVGSVQQSFLQWRKCSIDLLHSEAPRLT